MLSGDYTQEPEERPNPSVDGKSKSKTDLWVLKSSKPSLYSTRNRIRGFSGRCWQPTLSLSASTKQIWQGARKQSLQICSFDSRKI